MTIADQFKGEGRRPETAGEAATRRRGDKPASQGGAGDGKVGGGQKSQRPGVRRRQVEPAGDGQIRQSRVVAKIADHNLRRTHAERLVQQSQNLGAVVRPHQHEPPRIDAQRMKTRPINIPAFP
jgi:hypothetical protein